MDFRRIIIIIGILLIPSRAYASILDLPSYLSGNDVSITNLQLTNTTTKNWANGNVEGGGVNIKAGSINSVDLAVSISTVDRWRDSFNDYTVSGMLPATSAGLSSDISAGVSYVDGYRVATSATNHTYTASKDTYVYINKGGYFNYSLNNNGSTSDSNPPTPSGDNLLLAKVITSGSAITSVVDSRTLSIQITTTTTNFPSDYRNQGFVSADSTTTFHCQPGQVAIGQTIYSRTTATSTKNIGTGTNWIEGSVPNYTGNIFVYAYNDTGSSWDFKYSSADVAYSDVDLNSAGIKRYYTTGGVNYRAIGWAYLSAAAVQLYQTSDFSDISAPSIASRKSTTNVSTTSTSLVNDNFADITFYSTGKRIRISWSTSSVNSGADINFYGIMIDGTDIPETLEGALCSSVSPGGAITGTWTGVLARGTHKVQGRYKANANTATIVNRIIEIAEL